MKFCLDTNIFIEAWKGYYSFDFFPEYWNRLDQLAMDGVVFASEEVKREIEDTDDDLKKWISPRQHFFKPIDNDVQDCLTEIFKDPTHQRLVDTVKGRSKADPWVIAHAMAEGAIVVTKEEFAPPGTSRIKIPNVCNDLGVEWINDYDLIRRLGISFSITKDEYSTTVPGRSIIRDSVPVRGLWDNNYTKKH